MTVRLRGCKFYKETKKNKQRAMQGFSGSYGNK
jgi:hypothetical protein